MKLTSTTIFITVALTLCVTFDVIFTYKLSNEVYKMNQQNERNEHIIDSLNCIIDSLNTRYEIFDNKPGQEFINILNAISMVESSNNPNAYNAEEDAVGILQIRKCMVDDVNRILGYDKFTYEDRWSVLPSKEMFAIFVEHYELDTAEEIARCWNGGPRGCMKANTLIYWNKIEEELYASR